MKTIRPIASASLFLIVSNTSHAFTFIPLVNPDFQSTTNTGANQVIDGWDEFEGTSATADPNSVVLQAGNSNPGNLEVHMRSNDGNYIAQTLPTVDVSSFGRYYLQFGYGLLDTGDPLQTNHGFDITLRLALWNTADNIELVGSDVNVRNAGEFGPTYEAQFFTFEYDHLSQDAGDPLQLRLTHLGPSGASLNDDGGPEDRGWRATSRVDFFLVAVDSVPEPSSALLLLGGMGILAGRRRRHA